MVELFERQKTAKLTENNKANEKIPRELIFNIHFRSIESESKRIFFFSLYTNTRHKNSTMTQSMCHTDITKTQTHTHKT